MQIPVSVIVVAFNAGNYISRCLKSILTQTFHDIELIIVDDGSTDNTWETICNYANNDNRIRIVHQQNSGVAKARQAGLDLATGAYSIFVDSDDWIESDMLETMYGQAIKEFADIVFCDFVEEDKKGVIYWKQDPGTNNSVEVMNNFFGRIHGSLCNKMIRRNLYEQFGIQFTPGLNFWEDECVVIRLLLSGCRVSYVNRAFYHYDHTLSDHPITSTWFYRHAGEFQLYVDSCAPYFNTPELKKVFIDRVADIIIHLTYNPWEEYEECRVFYKQNKSALMHSYLTIPRKLFCIMYFNGFRYLRKIRSLFQDSIES